MVKKRVKFNLALIFLVLIVFLVSGQQGCPEAGSGVPGQFGKADPRTQASTLGLDFSFVEGLEYLTSGKKLMEKEVVFLNILVENHGETPKQGNLCIRDDVGDIYGGIISECQNFRVVGAVYEDGRLVQPGKQNILFGEYIYDELPISQNVNAFITATYAEQLIASTTVPIPEPRSGRLTVESDPSPIKISIDKTVSLREEGYKTSLGIQFKKSGTGLKIKTPDFAKEGFIFNPQLSGTSLECEYSDPTINFVEFKEGQSTKLIRCSTLLPKEQITYPLLLNLQYGVEIEKKINFRIEKEEKFKVWVNKKNLI